MMRGNKIGIAAHRAAICGKWMQGKYTTQLQVVQNVVDSIRELKEQQLLQQQRRDESRDAAKEIVSSAAAQQAVSRAALVQAMSFGSQCMLLADSSELYIAAADKKLTALQSELLTDEAHLSAARQRVERCSALQKIARAKLVSAARCVEASDVEELAGWRIAAAERGVV